MSAWLIAGADTFPLVQDGEVSQDHFGTSIAQAGDVDGDGVGDLIVGAPGHPIGAGAGRVYLFSGRSGALVRTWSGTRFRLSNRYFGGSVAAAGDLDGDRVPEMVVGAPGAPFNPAPPPGQVLVLSGATGDVLHRLSLENPADRFGSQVCDVGDTDGDGIGDIGVSAVGAGTVHVFSGVTARQLSVHVHPGRVICGAGDVDRDGLSDLAVGHADGVFVYSGMTGRLVWSRSGPPGGGMGSALAGLGDVDGDGVPDLAASAPHAAGGGHIILLSGLTGDPVWVRTGGEGNLGFGLALARVDDRNGDGRSDLLVDRRLADGTREVCLCDGGTGEILTVITNPSAGADSFGVSFSGLGNAGLVVGAPGFDGHAGVNAGRVWFFANRAD